MEAITARNRLTNITALNDAFRSSVVAGDVAITQGIAALCWKLDCHDRDLRCGSPDPADPSVTTRVLTVMRADEC